jgi:FtsP/CotA-like multicopper oxidase with cupredoxin domain
MKESECESVRTPPIGERTSSGSLSKRLGVLAGVFIVLAAFLCLSFAQVAKPADAIMTPTDPGILNPFTIPKFVNQLTGPPPVYTPTTVMDDQTGLMTDEYVVDVNTSIQQLLPSPLPKTPVWAYGGIAHDALTGADLGFVRNSPAPSFEAKVGTPVNVQWVNNLTVPHMFAVDPTLMWADPNMMGMVTAPFPPFPPGFPQAQSNVPIVTHLHGAEVQSTSDGGPMAWWTASGTQGMTYSTYRACPANAAVYHYPNGQLPTTLWYHDHALGMTRINVMSGLAGFYFLRDVNDPIAPLLPSGKYEVPLAIQDRIFKTDGSLFFPAVGNNPDVNPYWLPEFFGNTIMVNGLVWPNMNVDKAQYMYRVLDGSNARFYTLYFSNFMPFKVIASDGGYLKAATTVNKLTIAPGERYVILVDFSNMVAGQKIKLLNSAKAPFPSGDYPNALTDGVVMQFTVGSTVGPGPKALPAILNPTVAPYPSLGTPSLKRIMTLFEVQGPNGPLMVTLNGQRMSSPVTELPVLGTTEEWQIVDTTMDAHPIHTHLATFQLLYRVSIDMMNYTADWLALQGGNTPPFDTYIPLSLDWQPYVTGPKIPAPPYEQGWKDTVKMLPGQVSVFRIKFSPNNGDAEYPFDATVGPGYVWHCHIIDHEDNEMMRPYFVVAPLALSVRPTG